MINNVFNIIKTNINKKICVISDIHFVSNYNLKLFDKIIDNIKSNKPDYICIPGDLVDTPLEIRKESIKYFISFIEKLSKICKVYISIGNHDMKLYDIHFVNTEFYNKLNKNQNVKVLDNEIVNDNNIRFIGFTQDYRTYKDSCGYEELVIKDLNKLLKIDDNKYNILITHDPLYIQKVKKQINDFNKLDLIICGHTHNGLMPSFIKGNTSIVSPNMDLFVKNSRGYIKSGKTNIIISGGIIKLSKASSFLSIFNFLYPSTINYIELKK